MNGWANVYQNINSAQQINNFLLSQLYNNKMNQMNQIPFNNMNNRQMNNPLAQIQMTSNMIQNNSPQVMGGAFHNMNMNQNQNQNQQNDFRINLCFSTIQGARIMMSFDKEETVDGALVKFLKKCNLDHLIHNIKNELTFLLSGQSLKFGNFKKLKDIVLLPLNVSNVLVIDTNNLIGA